MANELQTIFRLWYSRGGVEVEHPTPNESPLKQIDVGDDGYKSEVYPVSTSGIPFSTIFGEVVTAGGYMYLENLDTGNNVYVRDEENERDVVELQPGDWCIFRTGSSINDTDGSDVGYEIVADTAQCNVRVIVFNE